ncbi:GNAT family N-acetyltransferase [Cyclobacterium xiamenense]|uniref:GNAT family N-acetyltransferase n=1 Tax=Cyclobacterium xiamenense TaxID=1297121 RepID=UPI0012B6E8CB|nr:GNAT family N-acetyltransferase [Cyclobacterium xiamenense]
MFYQDTDKIILVTFDNFFFGLSFFWLEDAELSKLIDLSDFSLETHEKWFASLKTKDDYKVWGILLNNEPIGVCGLKNICNGQAEYWGYIGEKKYWGKGVGKLILGSIERTAKNFGINILNLKVNKRNVRAVKLYYNCYFKLKQETDVYFIMSKEIK